MVSLLSSTRGSYRTKHEITIETDPKISAAPIVRNVPSTGLTVEFTYSGVRTAQADANKSMRAGALRLPDGYTLMKVAAHAKNPRVSYAPAIDYEHYVLVDSDGKVVGLFGSHDPFPSHGASTQIAGQQSRTLFDNAASWIGAWGLLPFAPTTNVWELWMSGSISIDGISISNPGWRY